MRCAFKLAKPLQEVGCFGRVGVRIGQIEFVIFDGVVGFVFAPGNFAETIVNPERVGEGLAQLLIVGESVIEFAGAEIGNGTIEQRGVLSACWDKTWLSTGIALS